MVKDINTERERAEEQKKLQQEKLQIVHQANSALSGTAQNHLNVLQKQETLRPRSPQYPYPPKDMKSAQEIQIPIFLFNQTEQNNTNHISMHSSLKKDFLDGRYQLFQPFIFLSHFQPGLQFRNGDYVFLATKISE
jgi:hypothetical protein